MSATTSSQSAHRLFQDWRKLPRDKADTLFLLLACLLVLLPHAWHLPVWGNACVGSILTWRAFLTWQGKRLPPPWMMYPLVAATTALVYLEYHRLLGREPGVTLLVVLLACKLMEMHAKRDLFVVIFLSLFVILTNFLYSQTILTALLMIVAVIAILTAQMSFQYTDRAPPFMRRLRHAGLIVLLAVPLSLLLFLLFPRISGPLWGLPNDAQSGKFGLAPDMSPGNIAHLAQSDDIAFRARFHGPLPIQEVRYWRGPVLGNYDGRTWSKVKYRWQPPLRGALLGGVLSYQVTQEATNQHWLYVLEMPAELPQLDHDQATLNPEFELLTARPIGERIRYEVRSATTFRMQHKSVPTQEWLALPPGFNPQTQELARQLQQQYPQPLDEVNAVLHKFRTEPFRYTLDPPLLGLNEIDDFLFSTKAGFCEHYASAFAVLMRASGIPARVVTGYMGGDVNPVDGYMVVRQSDAHAWAEVWIANRGWVRVDPTAAVAPERVEKNLNSYLRHHRSSNNLLALAGGLIGQDAFPFWAQLQNNWIAFNNSWNQWVLDYSPKRQREFLEQLGFSHPDWGLLLRLSIGLGLVVVLLMSLPVLWQRQKRDPYELIYDKLCQQLADRGWPRQIHEGPQGYATRLRQEMPDKPLRAAVLRFLAVYSACQYGPSDARITLANLKSLYAQCQ